jgi:predicted metal-dependent phosphoesterase TrpH
MAHPYSLNEDDPEHLEEIVRGLKRYGLQGIESYYPKHTQLQTKQFLALAQRLSLAVTGGTDFHGEIRPDIELGVFPCGRVVPDSVLDDLRLRRELSGEQRS